MSQPSEKSEHEDVGLGETLDGEPPATGGQGNAEPEGEVEGEVADDEDATEDDIDAGEVDDLGDPDDDDDDDDGDGEAGEAGDEAYNELEKIFNARELAEAELVKSILESFHIPSAIEDAVSADVVMRGGGFLTGVDVFVPARLAEKARLVLCERGIVCPVDDDELAGFLDRVDPARTDEAARDRLADDLDQEFKRELRHAALARFAEGGTDGLGAALAMAARSAARDAEDAHLAQDLAWLVNRGVFGGAASQRTVGELSRIAASPHPRARRRAAEALGKLRDAGAAGALVTLLEDDDEAVRDEAVESLFFLSGGVQHGFRADAPESERREAVARWRRWHEQNPSA